MNPKSRTLFLAAAITLSMAQGMAQVTVIDSGYCGAKGDTNLTWTLYSDSTLHISGSGAMDDYDRYYTSPSYYAPWDSYCNTIRTVVIDRGVTSIGDDAFSICNNLTTATLSNSLISIGVRAFAGCTRLNPITLPDRLISIGDRAFVNCYRFYSVTIPSSVTSIGHQVFEGCRILSSINVDSNNQRYSSIDGVVYSKLQDTLILCPQAKGGQVIIPNSVIVIGDNAFSYCENLNFVTIPNSVITIGNEAFAYCQKLNTVNIGNSVTTIGDWAFNSYYLTSVICNAIIPPALGERVFNYVPTNMNIPIYIPCLTYNSYSNASGWSQYSNFIINGHVDTTFYDYTTCYGIPYTDANFTTPIYEAGLYTTTLANSSDCDSIICLNLVLHAPTVPTVLTASICQGETYTDNNFSNLTTTGIYYDTLQTVNGCDSIIELTLVVHAPSDLTVLNVSISSDSSYFFAGKNLTQNGIYYDTLQTIHGCDSIIELTLTITGVGIVETDNYPSLRVYPNPTTGKLIVEIAGQARNCKVHLIRYMFSFLLRS